MPNKITKIILENYRAFYDINTINIGGKNVLIYGENGSGKSSLYEGLKRCFESCTLPSVYFSTHLLAPPSSAKISLLFENETLPYEFDDTVPVSSQPFKVSISKAYKNSGFLSYRELLRTHLMSNLYDEEVFETEFAELLITQILAYQEIKTPYTYFSLWERLNQPKVDRKIKISLLRDFDTLCTQKLIDIAVLANRILAYFDKDLVIALNLRLPSTLEYRVPKNKQSKQNIPVAKIALNVHLNGVLMSNADELHLTLLNEARLSALAISIYFASLLLDSQYEDYRILFLDDIFIGLDMSNRLPLLEILKTEFSGWQIFMTTYDRHWFEVAKRQLPVADNSNWLAYEMYVGEATTSVGNIAIPFIKKSKSYIELAEFYLKKYQHPECANNLRKALEQKLREPNILPSNKLFVETTDAETGEKEIKKQQKLHSLLSIFIEYTEEIGLNTTEFIELKNFKDWYLNPFSHDNIETPLYRVELEKALNLVKKINDIKIIKLLEAGEEIYFEFNQNEEYRKYILILVDNLYIMKHNSKIEISNPNIKCIRWYNNTEPFDVSWPFKLKACYLNKKNGFERSTNNQLIDKDDIDIYFHQMQSLKLMIDAL